MGFLDSIMGRSKPIRPNLDQLFALPGAAITLDVAMGLKPTGAGSVSFRAAEGGAMARTQQEIVELLDADGGPPVEASTDSYGYTWLVCRHDPDDVEGLVTDLHAVNSSLEAAGFGPYLLCSVVGFHDPDRSGSRSVGLVYLYKRGSFYPFAPTGSDRRDNALELQVKSTLASDLKIEPDLGRWFPVWGAPGL